MNLADFILITIVVVLAIGVIFLVYRVTKFEYTIEEKHLIMEWYFLGFLPIKSKIGIDSMIEVQEINSNQFFSTLLKNKPWLLVWGKPFRKMVLIKRSRGFNRTILISPADPDTFASLLRVAIGR